MTGALVSNAIVGSCVHTQQASQSIASRLIFSRMDYARDVGKGTKGYSMQLCLPVAVHLVAKVSLAFQFSTVERSGTRFLWELTAPTC